MFTEELVREHTCVPRIVEEAEGENRSMTLPSADPPGEAGRAMTHSDFGYLSSQAAAVTPRVNDEPLVSDLVPQALSWSSLNGLVIGDKNHKVRYYRSFLLRAFFRGFACCFWFASPSFSLFVFFRS
jgi:hypothetical protein